MVAMAAAQIRMGGVNLKNQDKIFAVHYVCKERRYFLLGILLVTDGFLHVYESPYYHNAKEIPEINHLCPHDQHNRTECIQMAKKNNEIGGLDYVNYAFSRFRMSKTFSPDEAMNVKHNPVDSLRPGKLFK